MNAEDIACALNPIGRSAFSRFSPTALPIRMLTAMANPRGNMKTNAAQLMAI
jgi:hypothetical protein